MDFGWIVNDFAWMDFWMDFGWFRLDFGWMSDGFWMFFLIVERF